uniref:Retrotransposon gag domain-containing protein n=1 Tax=Cannabis sativa TaxID=3483 RepID=A0A803PBI5_CANSA
MDASETREAKEIQSNPVVVSVVRIPLMPVVKVEVKEVGLTVKVMLTHLELPKIGNRGLQKLPIAPTLGLPVEQVSVGNCMNCYMKDFISKNFQFLWEFQEDFLAWWDMMPLTWDVTRITWEEFQDLFNAKYYNETVCSRNRKEFTQLT